MSFMLYASWSDIKTREVSNKVWAVLGPVGLALTLIQIFLTGSYSMLDDFALAFLITTGLAIGLFYLGFFGGADAKALICLSVSLPYIPNEFFSPLSSLICERILPISALFNAILTSVFMVLYALLRNVFWAASGKPLFEGLKSEPLSKKLASLFTGYKVKVSNLNKIYLYPIEKIEETPEDGITRKFQVFVQAEADREDAVNKIEEFSKRGLVKEVWVTPALPFLVFITVGLFASLLFGDIIFWLLSLIWKI